MRLRFHLVYSKLEPIKSIDTQTLIEKGKIKNSTLSVILYINIILTNFYFTF